MYLAMCVSMKLDLPECNNNIDSNKSNRFDEHHTVTGVMLLTTQYTVLEVDSVGIVYVSVTVARRAVLLSSIYDAAIRQ